MESIEQLISTAEEGGNPIKRNVSCRRRANKRPYGAGVAVNEFAQPPPPEEVLR